MPTNIIPIDQARAMIPQRMQERMLQGQSMNNSFADGVRDAFPVLSIRGKVFRVRVSGEETPLIDPQTRQPVPYLDIVLAAGSTTLSKAYYQRGFTEGDFEPPICWSLDSFKPDASVVNKQSVTCQNCPKNAFGSAPPSPDGTPRRGKACQDGRRIVVVMPHQLDDDQQMLLLLRIPQSSLKNLKNYAQHLERNGIDASGCITRLAFDYQEAFPKLLFNFVAPLDAQEYDTVIDLAASDITQSMLQAPDFDMAPSTEPQANASAGVQGLPRQAGPVLATDLQAAQKVAKAESDPVAVMDEPTLKKTPKAPDDIISLPDGRQFNKTTGEFIEPPAEDLSHLIKLPDGKVFNTKTNAYEQEPQPESKTKRAPAKKEKPTIPQPAVQLNQAEPEEDTNVVEEAKDENPNVVKPAPQSMESLLTKLVPKLN
jgi:hypothetical protein